MPNTPLLSVQGRPATSKTNDPASVCLAVLCNCPMNVWVREKKMIWCTQLSARFILLGCQHEWLQWFRTIKSRKHTLCYITLVQSKALPQRELVNWSSGSLLTGRGILRLCYLYSDVKEPVMCLWIIPELKIRKSRSARGGWRRDGRSKETACQIERLKVIMGNEMNFKGRRIYISTLNDTK